MSFLLEVGSAGQGGQGDFHLPPMPPWTPYTPFKRPRDTPGPPLWRKGYFPLFLDRQEPYRTLHLVWSGASNQSGTATGTHFAWPRCRGASRCTRALPWRPLAYTPRIIRRHGAGGGISCAVGDSGPPGDGREPSWARPCEASGALFLSNGGTGGGQRVHAAWPPPDPPLLSGSAPLASQGRAQLGSRPSLGGPLSPTAQLIPPPAPRHRIILGV